MFQSKALDLTTVTGIFAFAVNFILVLCVMTVLAAVVMNFIKGAHKKDVKAHKKSIVATGTMTVFFVFYYWVIRSKIGVISLNNTALHTILAVFGLIAVSAGCVINVLGRLALGGNWANHIKIYKTHTLVDTSVYKYLRHPLYAGIIYMFYGAAFIYANWLAFIANSLIFIPFIYYRAKQEEGLLSEQFENYRVYAEKTGMFFPKIFQIYKR